MLCSLGAQRDFTHRLPPAPEWIRHNIFNSIFKAFLITREKCVGLRSSTTMLYCSPAKSSCACDLYAKKHPSGIFWSVSGLHPTCFACMTSAELFARVEIVSVRKDCRAGQKNKPPNQLSPLGMPRTPLSLTFLIRTTGRIILKIYLL